MINGAELGALFKVCEDGLGGTGGGGGRRVLIMFRRRDNSDRRDIISDSAAPNYLKDRE